MYNDSDPRATLPAAKAAGRREPAVSAFADAEYGRFYQDPPQVDDAAGRTWYVRGQNFIIAYTEANPGGRFDRTDQVDEYAVLSPAADRPASVVWNGERHEVPGFSITFVPPGSSSVTMPPGGVLVRIFTTRSGDLAAACANAAAYVEQHPNLPPFEAWPEPSGRRVRTYSLDVPNEPGRFGRIWRGSTIMVNYLPTPNGPRDITKLSPHHHNDFEQCSLALAGAYTHHLRWPWTPDLGAWRPDQHELCASPSVVVIPPRVIHTSRAMHTGLNLLVDIFCPPRIDFSEKPGWVLNAADYPMPEPTRSVGAA